MTISILTQIMKLNDKVYFKCQNEHEFESWFSNSEEFENLTKKNLLDCIYCSSKKIKKSIMAPTIVNSKNTNENINLIDNDFNNERKKLLKLRKYIENNFDYVGKDFSKS